MSLWRWADMLEPVPESARLTLGEGNTQVVRSRRLGPSAGLKNLFFKLEHGNASGSYKDRFAFTAVSHMIAAGKTKCIATSSGNTGAALAAYCAAAGIECRIAVVEGAPLGKLSQMMAYGAQILRVRRFGTDPTMTKSVMDKLKELGSRPDSALQISAFVYCPAGMSGVRTISYELNEQFPDGLSHIFCPAGGGGMCVAVGQGIQELNRRGLLPRVPAVECVQPEGNDTIATPLREGAPKAREVNCTSLVSGLQVASVIDGDLAIDACRSTGGTGHIVSDQFVWDVQKRLAREEGVFTEPAGAVSVAGALKAAERGELDRDANIVCMVTGSGFKDIVSVDRINSQQDCPVVDAEGLDAW